METYKSLTFSNFFQIIVKNTIYSRDVKSKCFKNLMKWSGLSEPTPQNLSPWINGKRMIAQDYTDVIKQDKGLKKVQACIEENILPRLLSVDNTITELSVLLQADRYLSPSLKKQIYSAYTDPKLFIAYSLYYSLMNDHVAPAVLPHKPHSVNLDLVTAGISLPKSRNPVWGREKDCKKIAKILGEHSIVFLWGVAGIGKSEFAERFPELSLFYRLSSPFDSEMICIFAYFCPCEDSAREIREILCQSMQEKLPVASSLYLSIARYFIKKSCGIPFSFSC